VKDVVSNMGGSMSEEVKSEDDLSTRSEENKGMDSIEEALRRISSDKGWVAVEKSKIKEKTGRWERLLLKSNLGRRWIERI
jgi:hypothetical protein